jgi:hypothetical protein
MWRDGGVRRNTRDPSIPTFLVNGVIVQTEVCREPKTPRFRKAFRQIIPGNTPGSLSISIPGRVPGSLLGNLPGDIPGRFPGDLPGRFPGILPGFLKRAFVDRIQLLNIGFSATSEIAHVGRLGGPNYMY